MDGTSNEKARLREDLLAARRARSGVDLEIARAAIREHVLSEVAGAECVAAYVPLHSEPGSVTLLEALHARGVAVIVPVTLPDRDLDWVRWTPDGLGTPLGLDAIGRAGLVLVPALAVALDGTRLGRGGGSYDRALTRVAPSARVAALLFEGELVDHLPRDRWDVTVPAVVTPAGWVGLDRNTDVGFSG
jgi:5-formyltetrahydrofolate cyclo-ligase